MKIIKNGNSSVKENSQTNLFITERENAIKTHLVHKSHKDNDSAAVFLDFLKPVFIHFKEMLVSEQILYIGMSAWNLANIKMLAPGFFPNFKMEADEELGLPDELSIEFGKLIERKEKQFYDYSDFIVDFEMNPLKKKDEKGFEFKLKLNMKSKEDFLLDSAFDNNENEDDFFDDESDFESGFIDRGAVIIYPKKSFIDWAKDQGAIIFNSNKGNVYLINESDNNLEIEKWVRKNYKAILEHEFLDCDLENIISPSKISYSTFLEWFDVKTSCLVYDMEDAPVLKL